MHSGTVLGYETEGMQWPKGSMNIFIEINKYLYIYKYFLKII